jgi:molybdopterin/thiamine biosynthesis adenylyltransferase
MRNWTEALPGRLDAEVEDFSTTEGLDFELDEAERAASGRVVFRGTLTVDGREPIRLEVRYAESFPYLRPEVFAPELRLGRHQNPYRHNLCLLDRSTRHWNPSDTGAWLVSVRVPLLLDLLDGDPEILRREEAPQGEPASYYFPPQSQTAVFVPAEMLQLPHDAHAGLLHLSVGDGEALGELLRAGLTRVSARDARGKAQVLAQAAGPFAERFNRTVCEGRWVRLDAFPADGGTADHLFAAARQVPGFEPPPPQSVAGASLRVLGVVCEEEVRQGVYEDTWLFAVEVSKAHVSRYGKRRQQGRYTTRGSRLTPEDLAERIPTLAGLAKKTIALTGLGALGGPVALEFARTQVGELRVLDHDIVEAGTIVRWPFGLSVVGHAKSRVINDYVAHDYPFTRVRALQLAIGVVPGPGETPPHSEAELLTEFLDGVDVLVDATAEIGVQQLMAALADEAGIPQVYVSATEGGWGGVVARVVPGQTGCWWCLQKRLDDGSISAPPWAPTGTVQPRGCAAPTWTGTSFDALPLVAQAVRTATFTALAGRADDNPRDVFVCAQPAQTAAELAAPQWTSYALEPHPECTACAAADRR